MYDYIKLGKFSVGLMDTLLLDSNYQYEAYNYQGHKPYFVQIWHPLRQKNQNEELLKLSDFFAVETKDELLTVRTQLIKHYQEAIIRDCIEENWLSGELNDFSKYTFEDIFKLIITETTMQSARSKEIATSQFPVIIYHHGAQSSSFENFAMAEYFASHGFIFIAANFHLPYENTLFGLKPFDKIVKNEEEQSLRAIFKLAQSLSGTQPIFFIGHSLGAQMGFRTFDQETNLKGFISLETTIEFKTDQEKIKEMWAEVFQKIAIEKANYPFPVLLCAATGEEKPFAFFENLNAYRTVFAPTKETFEHNAYLSIFYLRLFIKNDIVQTDKEILQDNLLLYAKHLKLMHEFILDIIYQRNKPNREVKLLK